MTVVLLHALAVSGQMWAEPHRMLERAGHRVLAPDQRGYGATPLGSAAPSLDVVADDLAEVLDTQGLREVTLVGCSMGGYVAMAFLRRHPARVRALALLATRADADDEAAAARRETFAEVILDPQRRPAVLEQTIPTLVGETTRTARPDVLARLTELVQITDPAAIAWSQRAIATRQDSLAILREVQVPSVVIAGEEDGLVTVAEHQRVVDALPDSKLITVRRSGHLTPMEAPDEVAAAIDELVSRSG